MKKNKDNISIFEASEFWDEHDLLEFDDVNEVNDVEFKLKKKKYIPLDDDIYRQIIPLAKSQHKSSEELITDWIKEILKGTSAKVIK